VEIIRMNVQNIMTALLLEILLHSALRSACAARCEVCPCALPNS
jgi:hypothetical protein